MDKRANLQVYRANVNVRTKVGHIVLVNVLVGYAHADEDLLMISGAAAVS